jgi:hypothetical protein
MKAISQKNIRFMQSSLFLSEIRAGETHKSLSKNGSLNCLAGIVAEYL